MKNNKHTWVDDWASPRAICRQLLGSRLLGYRYKCSSQSQMKKKHSNRCMKFVSISLLGMWIAMYCSLLIYFA